MTKPHVHVHAQTHTQEHVQSGFLGPIIGPRATMNLASLFCPLFVTCVNHLKDSATAPLLCSPFVGTHQSWEAIEGSDPQIQQPGFQCQLCCVIVKISVNLSGP